MSDPERRPGDGVETDGCIVPSAPSSVRLLRRYAVRTAVELGWVDVADTVALLVSEVATNALVHGAGRVRVRVQPTTSGLRVEVHDEDSTLPSRRQATPLDEGGRGIALVDALSSGWGAETTPDGKTVWFEVAAATA